LNFFITNQSNTAQAMSTASTQNCTAIAGFLPPGNCRKLLRAVSELKARLRERYERVFVHSDEQIEAALANAEALAWETSFPHLVLPLLAEELLDRASARQRGGSPRFAYAA
jgi:hypothetical protein